MNLPKTEKALMEKSIGAFLLLPLQTITLINLDYKDTLP
jgi:hypothetical protein